MGGGGHERRGRRRTVMGSPYGLDQARKRSVSATAPFERLESVMSEPWWMDFSAVSVAAGLPPVEEEEPDA